MSRSAFDLKARSSVQHDKREREREMLSLLFLEYVRLIVAIEHVVSVSGACSILTYAGCMRYVPRVSVLSSKNRSR